MSADALNELITQNKDRRESSEKEKDEDIPEIKEKDRALLGEYFKFVNRDTRSCSSSSKQMVRSLLDLFRSFIVELFNLSSVTLILFSASKMSPDRGHVSGCVK